MIDKEKDSVYKRIEELPATVPQSADQQTPSMVPPLRPDGTFRHPGSEHGSVRVYYRRDRNYNNATLSTANIPSGTAVITSDEYPTIADSGNGSLSHRRSTPNAPNLNTTSMSPYSTLGKFCLGYFFFKLKIRNKNKVS